MIYPHFAQQILRYYPQPSQFLIAFSGGLDSTALLALLAKFCQQHPHFSLRAIHIHHGLSANADQWLSHCQQRCQAFHIPFLAKKVQISTKQGVEAGAREARYQAIKSAIMPQEILVTAHHQQDQTESFLLALKRGSGIQGLGAMQVQNQLFSMSIFRPLLGFSRQQLQQYVQQQGLTWIEDESNQDNQYDRNFLRNQVLPQLRQRWHYFDNAVQRAAQHCYEQQQLLNELLMEDFLLRYNKQQQSLSIKDFAHYSLLKQKALLRLWLQQAQMPMPSQVQLEQIIHNVILAAQDKNPEFILAQQVIRRYQQQLFITPIYQDLSHYHLTIQVGQSIQLPDNLGQLSLTQKDNKITAHWHAPQGDYCSEFISQQTQFIVKFHYAGTVKLSPNTPHKDIKKIWQQFNLPVWQRKRIPYLFIQQAQQLKLKSAVGFFVVFEQEE